MGEVLKKNFPDLEADAMPATGSCALDVADRGGVTLERAGELANITRERVRQLELVATSKLKLAGGRRFAEHADGDRVAVRGLHMGRGMLGLEAHDEEPSVDGGEAPEDGRSDGAHIAVGPLGTGFTRPELAELDAWAERVVDRMFGGVRLRDALRWESESDVEGIVVARPLSPPGPAVTTALPSAREPQGAKIMGKQKVRRETVVAFVREAEAGRTIEELQAQFGWASRSVAQNALWNHQKGGAPLERRDGRWFATGAASARPSSPPSPRAAAPKRAPRNGGGATPAADGANDTPLVKQLRGALRELEDEFEAKASKLRDVIVAFGGTVERRSA